MRKMQAKIIDDILRLIRASQNILLSSHHGPDGDSLGSQIAFYLFLKSLGKNVWIYNDGHIPHYFHGFDKIKLVENNPEKWIVPQGGFDLGIIFECTSEDRVGDVAKLLTTDMNLINIDHHRENKNFGKYNLVDIEASSVGEMIYRIFKQAGFEIDMEVAEYIFVAILTDTGRFHFTSTTPESLRVTADLISTGINVKRITDEIYYNSGENQLRLIGEILAKMELFLDGRVCFLTLRRTDLNKHSLKYGDMEGLVEWSMRIRGVKVGALLKDINDDFTKISLRSQGDIDVCKLAQSFNGGGHLNASGCHIDANLDTAKKQLLEQVKVLLENGS